MKKFLAILLAALLVIPMSIMAFAADVKSIEVKNKPFKTEYIVGEILDVTGLVLTVTNDDESTIEIDGKAEGITYSLVTLSTVGTQTITVAYGGKTATFTVTVKEKPADRLVVLYYPNKIEYEYGEELDLAGLTVAFFEYGKDPVRIPYNAMDWNFGFKGYDKNKTGEQTVTVTYKGASATFKVIVLTPLDLKVFISDLTVNYKQPVNINPVIIGQAVKCTYRSSDPRIVTVDDNGTVTGLRNGTATITVIAIDQQGNIATDTCNVTVKVAFWQWLIKIFLFGWIWY